MKMNSLVDPAHDRRAVRGVAGRASRSTSIVRGICCLRPGVPGPVRAHPGALDRRPLPRALPHLPLRQRRRPGRAGRATSARPTSCPATSTAGSRRSCRCVDPALQRRLQRDPRRQPGRRHARPGRSGPTARGRTSHRGGTVDTHRRLQQLAVARTRRARSMPSADRPSRSDDRRRRRGAGAAGGVVWRDGDDGVEVLLVHRPRYDDWSLPKGKCDRGESYEACDVPDAVQHGALGIALGSTMAVCAPWCTADPGPPKAPLPPK